MQVNKIFNHLILPIIGISIFSANLSADKLDDIIAEGEIKCGIMLDVPPVGMRDNDNNQLVMM